MAKDRLFLIDGHALCYRSFFAIRNVSTSKGQATNAVLGFLNTLKKIMRVYKPEYMAVCFDSHKKTYRQEKFAEYKIQRPKMPEELIEQIPIIKEVVQAYNLSIFEFGGFEADDIIATLTKQASENNVDVVIVSEDKDLYQLAEERVSFFSTRKDNIIGYDDIKDKLGFDPRKMSDFIGLAGDKSDNIPGINGVGEVTARKLINEFGNLENIYENVELLQPVGFKDKLLSHKKEAFLSKELAVLETSVPFSLDLSQLKVDSPDEERLRTLFKELEFRKLERELGGSINGGIKVKVKIVDNKKDINQLISDIKSKGKFAFLLDTADEDLFSSSPLRGIFISVGEKDAFYVPLDGCQYICDIFRSKEIIKITYDIKQSLKVLQNAGFLNSLVPTIEKKTDNDGTVLTIKNKSKDASVDEILNEFFVIENAVDIMIAEYLLSDYMSAKGIDNLAWTYLNVSLDNNEKKEKEVNILFTVFPIMQKALQDKSIYELFKNIEMPLAYVLFGMESYGVRVDEKYLKKLSVEFDKSMKDLSVSLYKMAGEEFNLNSPKQLSVILFEKMKLPATKKIKTGYSTKEEVLSKLAVKYEFPKLILKYRKLAKLKSTYIDAFPKLISEKTGKIHAHFNQVGTETGRLSSNNPNLQNIPIRSELGKKIRKAIVPSGQGMLMMKADYSQIELRILAHLSGDENMIKAFNYDEDIHRYTASLIFDISENDVTSQMRDSAKRVNFGIIYGMSAFGLAKDLKISNPEAQDFIDKYFLRYPKVKMFMNNAIKECEEKGYAVTLFNRRRILPDINSRNITVRQFAQRQAINTPVQGSAADLIKLSMVNVYKRMSDEKLKSKMLITVHDELVFDLFDKEKDDMISLVREEMENPLKLSVPIKVDIQTGKNWLEMEKVL